MIRIFHNTRYDFIRWWRVMAITTAAFILLGLASVAVTGGPRYSIEFTGGTLMQLAFKQRPDVSQLRATIERAGIRGAEITQFGSDREYRHMIEPDPSGARLRDEIEYEPPLRPLGRLVAPLLVGPRLRRLFDYRHEVTRAWCESGV